MKSVRSPGVLGILGLAFGSLGGFFAPGHPLRPPEVSRRYRMNKLRGRSARRRRYGPLHGAGSKWETKEDRARWLGANGPKLNHAEEARYTALEREHLGDPEAKTGIYADIPQ